MAPLRFLLLKLVVCWTAIWLSAGLARADAITDYNLAVVYYNQSRWQFAADACRDYLKKYPGDAQAPVVRLYLGQSLAHLRQFAEAHEQFAQFLTESPQHADRPLAMYRLGECSYFEGEYARAETELAQFTQAHLDHPLAEWGLVYLGESAFRQKHFERSLASFELGLGKFPAGQMADDARFGRANALEALGRTEEALKDYESLSDKPGSPRAPQATYNLASRRFTSQQYEQAAAAFDKVATLAPGHRLVPQAQLHAGYAMYHLQRYPEAITRFAKIADDPQQGAAARFWKGLSEKSSGQLAEAARTFAASLDKEPQQALADQVMFQWADTLAQLQQFPRAEELFLKVVALKPEGELADDALHSAGEVALLAGKPQQAETLRERFVKEYPRSGMRIVNDLQYGRTLLALGDQPGLPDTERQVMWNHAAQVLSGVVQNTTLAATRTRAHYQLARAYERLARPADVALELDQVLADESLLAPEELRGSVLLRAHALQRTDQRERSRADYERVLTLSPAALEQQEALSGLATLLIQSGDWAALESRLRELQPLDADGKQRARLSIAAAEAALAAKDWRRAGDWFDRVLALGPEGEFSRAALSGKAQARYEQGEFVAAAELFQKLREAAGADRVLAAQSAYHAALSRQKGGDLVRALSDFEEASRLYSAQDRPQPDATTLATGRQAYQSAKAGARVARELGKIPEAEKLYESASNELRLQPDQAELDLLLNEWADLSYSAKNYARADELFALLVKERPDSPLTDDARLILAESLLFGKKRAEARQAIENLIADPRSDKDVLQRSLIHLVDLAAEAGDWEQVAQLCERISRDFPQNSQQAYVAYRRGESLLQRGQPREAAQVLQGLREEFLKSTAAAPEWWPETWVLLAECRWRMNEYPAVDELASELKIRKPDASQLLKLDLVLGRSLVSRAQFNEAREAFQRVVDSPQAGGTSAAAESQFRIAETWLTQKNHNQALQEYYKVYAGYDAPKWEAMALSQAAACDVELGNLSPAQETYRLLLKEFPDSQYAKDAQTRLKELENR